MKPIIYIHRYTLRSDVSLNAKSRLLCHEGALLKVDGEAGIGYACLHPWPELGDLELPELLNLLGQGASSFLLDSALHCAEIDASARARGINLFNQASVPQSHATLPLDCSCFESAISRGFKTAKVKMGRDMPSEYAVFRQLRKKFPQLHWRIDFNGIDATPFLELASPEELSQVDWIEDPHEEAAQWQRMRERYGCKIAADRHLAQHAKYADVLVVKPACHRVEPWLKHAQESGQRVVITTYMDHPLGQCYAAWCASEAKKLAPSVVDVCGLATQDLFVENDFSRMLGSANLTFTPPPGLGFGFDELLENLEWTPLR